MLTHQIGRHVAKHQGHEMAGRQSGLWSDDYCCPTCALEREAIYTCPSRRIAGVVSTSRKRAYGPIVTRRIGLEVLRKKCDHFAWWLARLENIWAE